MSNTSHLSWVLLVVTAVFHTWRHVHVTAGDTWEQSRRTGSPTARLTLPVSVTRVTKCTRTPYRLVTLWISSRWRLVGGHSLLSLPHSGMFAVFSVVFPLSTCPGFQLSSVSHCSYTLTCDGVRTASITAAEPNRLLRSTFHPESMQ